MQIPETEAEFQRRLTEQAEQLGWDWMHVGRTGKYSPNGAKGTLGTGWPDLILIRGGQVIFVELKDQNGVLSTAQKAVLYKMKALDCRVWRPSDWPQILEALQ